jgi:hypothetical protein
VRLLEDVSVIGGLDLGSIDCLLGQDLLKGAMLFHNGLAGTFTLIQSGVPPALPGRQPPFDISRG